MSCLTSLLPRLHDFLALLILRAQDPSLSAGKLLIHVRTIRRMTQAVIMAEVAIYQQRVKAAMLSDPDWRSRVTTQLGGHYALYQWRAQFTAFHRRGGRTPAQEARQCGDKGSKRAPNPTSANTDPASHQFRLAPLPRAFYGRISGERTARPYTPKPMISPFHAPILVTPLELLRGRAKQAASGQCDGQPCSDEKEEAAPPMRVSIDPD